RFDEIAAVRHLHRDDDALCAVEVMANVNGGRDGGRCLDAFPIQQLLHILRDLVDARPLLLPDQRQVTGEHHRRGAQPVVVSAAPHSPSSPARSTATAGLPETVNAITTPSPAFRPEPPIASGVTSARSSVRAPTKIVGASPASKARAGSYTIGRFIADVS